jgi:uncharacterized protein (TIGR03083 family)
MATRTLDDIRAATEHCYDAIENLAADLSEADLAHQSLCPDWTARGVFDHVGGIEAALAGWWPETAEQMPPFDRVAEYTADPTRYPDKLKALLDLRRRDIAALAADDLDRPSWMPVGPGTYGRLLAIRVFDIWVHERDIAQPLGRATDDGGIAAEVALDQVESSLGYIVGKKVGLPDGTSITIDLTGPVTRQLHVRVDGKARQVDHLDDPSVVLSTDSTTFIQLACGRIDPQEQIDAGAVTWTGDDALGDRAARNLRYTM